MSEKAKRSTAQWIELLAQKELPAITSMAVVLDKFSKDDVSSIPELSKAILHDQALSSCLLRVANSAKRAPVRKITTVSRAAIVLGIHAVKNICMTSKILEGLLKSKSLHPTVYERLMMLMANAFYAGLLAKMMVPDHSEDTQEEVYLAAMLYHIGETAFWGTGDEITDELIKEVGLPPAEFQQYCSSVTGIRFKDLSIGLARNWNLGELLIKSLDQPQSRSSEIQTISLANQLSAAINSPPKTQAEWDSILSEVCKITGTTKGQLKDRIQETRKLAIELLDSYGASVLESHIKHIPGERDFSFHKIKNDLQNMTPEQALLSVVKELTRLTQAKAGINELLALALRQMAQIFALDSCSFWVLSGDKKQLESRSSYNNIGQIENMRRTEQLDDSFNIMTMVVHKQQGALINDLKSDKWRRHIPESMQKIIGKGRLCLVPVIVNSKTIGVISGQFFTAENKLSDDDFAQFSFIVDHLNMCLSINAHHSKTN